MTLPHSSSVALGRMARIVADAAPVLVRTLAEWDTFDDDERGLIYENVEWAFGAVDSLLADLAGHAIDPVSALRLDQARRTLAPVADDMERLFGTRPEAYLTR